ERVHEYAPENVLKSELVKNENNVKVVDIIGRLDILPPGFKVQNIRNEITFYPAEKRITSRSIDFKLADINSEYRFEPGPDGKGTVPPAHPDQKGQAPLQGGIAEEGRAARAARAADSRGHPRPRPRQAGGEAPGGRPAGRGFAAPGTPRARGARESLEAAR